MSIIVPVFSAVLFLGALIVAHVLGDKEGKP